MFARARPPGHASRRFRRRGRTRYPVALSVDSTTLQGAPGAAATGAPSGAGAARRMRFSVAFAVVAILAAAAAERHGRTSRRALSGGPPGGAWGIVADADEALRAWRAAGLEGRRLVVLTGRWSRPPSADRVPAAPGPAPAPRAAAVRDALYLAARSGAVRAFDVVMPPEAFLRRRLKAAGLKEYAPGDGAFSQRFESVERRFSTVRGFRTPDELVLVLVEPSFFDGGVPADPSAWLRERGVRFDLALVALDDPEADDAQLAAARRAAQAAGAERLEVDP